MVPAAVAVVPPTCADFSHRRTSSPSMAHTSAAVMPAAPAPATRTSTSAWVRRSVLPRAIALPIVIRPRRPLHKSRDVRRVVAPLEFSATSAKITFSRIGGPKMNDAVLTARPHPISTVRWSAVLAGMVVGIAVHLVLNLGGVALGLALNARGNASGIPLPAGAWAVLSMLAGALVGGYVAGRASALRRIADGMLHGSVAWGATTLVFAVIAFTTSSGLAGGLFSAVAENGRLSAPAVAEGAGAISTPVPSTADNAARAASGWLAVATGLSLLTGLAGGALGARGARRFTHGILRPGITPNVTVTKAPSTTAR